MNETLKTLELLNRHLAGPAALDVRKLSPTKKPLPAEFVRQVKLRLLQMHFEAGVGHIGGNLSAIDTLLCLYHNVMGPDDRFVLSKGHAAGALYTTLWSAGLLTDADLRTYHKDGTRLSGHPTAGAIPHIPFATGSLGHGIGIAAGLALARKLRNLDSHVFCLTSDGEWNEGSCWEALIFARHQKLNNLTLIVDLNGLQGFGTTREVADLNSLADKFRAFGVSTQEIDGHDHQALCAALPPPLSPDGPRVIVAQTHKGFGVSFMEDKMEWHYLPMSAAQYATATGDIESLYNVPARIMGLAG
jgi:transketolase